jgi:xanthosine utilization system XapX-like protein
MVTTAPQDSVESGNDEAHFAEAHRALVREVNEQMGRAYGFVGGLALLTLLAGLVVGYAFGLLRTPALYMVTLTAGLIALFAGRTRAYAYRRKLRDRVLAYCHANGIDPDVLRDYYDRDELYPFFKALFEDSSGKPADERDT